MKRTLIILLTVCLLLSLCACGKEEAEEPVQILALQPMEFPAQQQAQKQFLLPAQMHRTKAYLFQQDNQVQQIPAQADKVHLKQKK